MAHRSTHHEVTPEFDAVNTMFKVHGILSIVFGGLGILGSLLIVLLMSFAWTSDNNYTIFAVALVMILVVVIGILPHLYLIIAGTHLLKQPRPQVAKTLLIINVIIGTLWNFVILVFAIMNLAQLHEYTRDYPTHRSK